MSESRPQRNHSIWLGPATTRRASPSWQTSPTLWTLEREVYDRLLSDMFARLPAGDASGADRDAIQRAFGAAELRKGGALLEEILALDAEGAPPPKQMP